MDQHEHRETRSGSTAQAAEWDARYSEGEGPRWSGRPNGRLVAEVGDEHREHIKSQGIDPADYLDADDLGRLLADEFTIELRAVKPRIDPPPDNPHIADVVLRPRRR